MINFKSMPSHHGKLQVIYLIYPQDSLGFIESGNRIDAATYYQCSTILKDQYNPVLQDIILYKSDSTTQNASLTFIRYKNRSKHNFTWGSTDDSRTAVALGQLCLYLLNGR